MSYQVLARKWRPSTFEQMVGQDHVLRALVNALDNDRLHHAYLFTGTRGVGKTSIARLFAKSLNCEEGVGSSPCGQCSPCREISEGRFVDLIEVDAASRTRVEDTRELLENVQYAPTRGRYKVYLIDEVHMLSAHSFNALLKTLEEPPPHIKFLLATTDPQKLPVTILSRCLQFNLKNMTPERIVDHLQQVLAAEQIPSDEPALWLLARAANGSMRDAMSLTDQAISFGSGELREDDVRAMLGSVDQQQVLRLLQLLAHGNALGAMDTVAQIAEYGADFEDVLAELLGLLHRVAVAQALPASVDNSLGDREAVLALAAALKAEDVQLFYQIALNGRKDLPLVPVPRDGFEMTLLRMLAFRPVMPGEVALPRQSSSTTDTAAAPLAQPETSETAAGPIETVQPGAAINAPVGAATMQQSMAPPPAISSSVTPQKAVVQPEITRPATMATSRPAVTEAESDTVSGGEAVAAPVAVSSAPSGAAITPSPTDVAPPPIDDAPPWGEAVGPGSAAGGAAVPPPGAPPTKKADAPEVSADTESPGVTQQEAAGELADISLETLDARSWIPLLDAIGLSGMTYNIAANAVVEQVETLSEQGARVHYLLSARQMHLFNATHQQRIEDALSGYFGSSVKIVFSEGDSSEETPAQFRERRRRERLAAAVAAIESDANVQAIIERFDGRLDVGSVQPIDS